MTLRGGPSSDAQIYSNAPVRQTQNVVPTSLNASLHYVNAVRSGLSPPRNNRNQTPNRNTNRKATVGRDRHAKTTDRSPGSWQQPQLRWSGGNAVRDFGSGSSSQPPMGNSGFQPTELFQDTMPDFGRQSSHPSIAQYIPIPKSYPAVFPQYTPLPPQLTVDHITSHNVDTFRQLNMILFPVRYNDRFYRDVCEAHAKELSSLGG